MDIRLLYSVSWVAVKKVGEGQQGTEVQAEVGACAQTARW